VETTSRRIEYAPLDDIAGTDGNPKGHDLPAVIHAIAALGFTDPIVMDERTGQLIIGNGRLEALRIIRDHLGGHATDKYATVFADKRVREGLGLAGEDTPHPPEGILMTPDGDWTVPLVRGWSSRDDEHARAAVIASNKISEMGGWDERALAEWLDDIADADPDLLNVTGFSPDDLEDLLADLGQVEEMPPQPTEARWAESPEEQAERTRSISSYADRKSGGAMAEMILVFPLEEHVEAVGLLHRIRARDGDAPAAQVVLTALRAYAGPDDDPGDGASGDA
jgi:hypothetical protein